MKFDPDTLKKARDWFTTRAPLLGIGALGLLGLLVLAANIRAGGGEGAAVPSVAVARAPAAVVTTPKPAEAAAPSAIPHIAQQAGAAPAAIAAAPAAPVPVAASIQPPAGIQRGFVVEKRFQADQFGNPVLIETKTVGVQTLSMQAPATDTGFSGPATSVEWSAWFNLAKPTTLAWVRLAGGQGTVTARIDGTSLGAGVEHWQTNGPTSSMATIALAAGWHQVEIHDERAHWVNGPGVAVRIDLGDGAGDAVSPQPWAVPPTAAAPGPAVPAIPQIAQHQPTATSTAGTPKPAGATTTGGVP